jgi:hypothetical protein
MQLKVGSLGLDLGLECSGLGGWCCKVEGLRLKRRINSHVNIIQCIRMMLAKVVEKI